MAGTGGHVLTELGPLALVIALSPLSIIPAVLVLQSPRPRPTGLAFLGGWLIGLAAQTAIFIGVSELFGARRDHPPGWASWLRIVVGTLLIAFGIWRWLTRHRNSHQIPGMRHITEAGPGKALIVGALLTLVNLKVLFICAAAGLAIGSAGIGYGMWLAWAIFIVVSSSTVMAPVLAYAVSGNRLDPALAKLKLWMEERHAVLVAAILVFIGLLVLYKGIHGL